MNFADEATFPACRFVQIKDTRTDCGRPLATLRTAAFHYPIMIAPGYLALGTKYYNAHTNPKTKDTH